MAPPARPSTPAAASSVWNPPPEPNPPAVGPPDYNTRLHYYSFALRNGDRATYLNIMDHWGGTALFGLRIGVDTFDEAGFESGYFALWPTPVYRREFLALPHWMLILATSARPLLWLRHRLRARPPHPGLCPTCRYDLRAHLPHSELSIQNLELAPRCPECGTPILQSGNKRCFENA